MFSILLPQAAMTVRKDDILVEIFVKVKVKRIQLGEYSLTVLNLNLLKWLTQTMIALYV
jgi:hypothetical protein